MHTVMRPHDPILLAAICSLGGEEWTFRKLALQTGISIGEISQSLKRSSNAQLYNEQLKEINRLNFKDFLVFGLPFVFPVQTGAIMRGIPAAHSAPPFSSLIASEEHLIYPLDSGKHRGVALLPLYEPTIALLKDNQELYEWVSLMDILRMGRNRERKIAINLLKDKLKT
jgi:hypothetical protein